MASKYRNRIIEREGIRFDSAAEYEYYLVLADRLARGEISALEVHPTFELQPAFRDANGKYWRAIRYEADFAYLEHQQNIVIDVKGVRTPVFLLKQKLFTFRYPTLVLEIVDVRNNK